jgi:uncharacterized membrane protein YhaH (DUF805 family)
MELFSAFFSSHGRIHRLGWFYRVLFAAVVCAAFGLLAREAAGDSGRGLFALIFLWSALAVSIQRLHDTGRTGIPLLLLLIPVAGPIWVLLLLLRRGADGPNAFGPDPLARLDYLKVDLSK